MDNLYLLDTNVLVHLLRCDRVGLLIQRRYDPLMIEPRPLISVVTAGELRSLAYQFRWGDKKREQAVFLLNYFRQTSIDNPDIIEAYAVIDAFSVRVGRSIGKNDLWIAASAKIARATLLTTDRDFDHLDPQFIARMWVPTEESDRP